MAASPSKARRLRAAAVKRKLWHRSFSDRTTEEYYSCLQSGDPCLELARHILTMNGYPLQWLMECSAVSVTVPVVTEGVVLGSVPAIVAEPGPRKANEGEEDEKENGLYYSTASWVDGGDTSAHHRRRT